MLDHHNILATNHLLVHVRININHINELVSLSLSLLASYFWACNELILLKRSIASGLNAAKELRSKGLEVLVLEARDRVGGRTLTKVEQSGNGKFWVDLGGSYVGPTQNNLLNLIEELKLETYLVDDTKDIVYTKAVAASGTPNAKCRKQSTGGDKDDICKLELNSRFKPESDPPFGNLFHWLDYVHMIKVITSYGDQIPSEAPWLAPKAEEWDAKSYKQFVDEHTWTRRVRDYFNNIFVTIDVCCDANEVSMLWFLWYIKQCGGYGRSISTTNGGQERKIKNGTQQLSERLYELLGASKRVLLNKPVCCINQSRGPYVQVTTLDGSHYRADYVICAVPPHLWLKIHHQPALPNVKNLLAQRSPMGQVGKVILYYERPFWKEQGISGCFMFDAESKVRSKFPIILSLDETKPDGSSPAIIGFTGARGWFEMRNRSDLEVGKLVAESYAQATHLEEFKNFIKVERFDWTGEQYSGGCYTSTHSMNTLFKFGPHLREPFGRIYYAGTETAIKWSGYMDGALSAGKRAAREVLHVKGILSEQEIWTVEPDNNIVPPKSFEYPRSHNYAPSIDSLSKIAHLLLVSGLLTFVAYRRYCL